MRAPSLVAQLYTSMALPLCRFTSTYQALVSTVAADADVAATVMKVAATSAIRDERHPWCERTESPISIWSPFR